MFTKKKKYLYGMLMGAAMVGTALINVACVSASPVTAAESASIQHELQANGGAVLPIGDTNDGYSKFFTGESYLSNLSDEKSFPVYNVTFAHGAHTFWHIHNGTCQVLVAASGRGYYQIWGEQAHELKSGDRVTIPAGVKHWHGAAPETSFQHIALMEPKQGITTTWLEPVSSEDYQNLK